jgi:hypothetical protein
VGLWWQIGVLIHFNHGGVNGKLVRCRSGGNVTSVRSYWVIQVIQLGSLSFESHVNVDSDCFTKSMCTLYAGLGTRSTTACSTQISFLQAIAYFSGRLSSNVRLPVHVLFCHTIFTSRS